MRSHTMEPRPILALENPNKPWVVKELDKLRDEWRNWLVYAQSLGIDPDFDPQRATEALMDGRANLDKHDILREKTLVFIGNNFSGYAYLFDNWPTRPHEDNTSRLQRRIPTWIKRLDMLASCIDYARVPDSFWKEQGKKLISEIISSDPERALEVAEKMLRNPSAI